jgi:polyprenyl P-hydroxybenzoate/phenylacrylic acid decarboxylase-like protein
MKKTRLIIGITGASGAVYPMRLLEVLKTIDTVEVHLVISLAGEDLLKFEIGDDAIQKASGLANFRHDINDLTAPISSGSYVTDGMIVAPCSAKTLSAIAHGYGNNLIHRAADVVLKERRRIVLLFRETPLSLVHIENMAKVTNMGGIIVPPIPAFYNNPTSIEDLVNHSIGKALDLFALKHTLYRRWEGSMKA